MEWRVTQTLRHAALWWVLGSAWRWIGVEREEVTWWGSTSCKWIFLLPRALEEASDASPCGKGHSHFKKDPKNLHLSFNFYTHLFSLVCQATHLINVMLYWCKFLWKLLLYTFFKEPISWPPLNFGCLLKARTWCAVPDFRPQNWFWNSYRLLKLWPIVMYTYWCVLTYFDALWHFNICSHEYANQRFLKTDKFWPFEDLNLYLNPGFLFISVALVGLSEFLLIFMIFSDREKAVCLMSIHVKKQRWDLGSWICLGVP